jgi:hypothetical protein
MNTKCTCGNCPKIREERGLLPFCLMDRTISTPKAGFSTYAEAAAVRSGSQRIRSVGGILKGCATRFVLI